MDLTGLGWRPFFARQLRPSESASAHPLRVVEIHRNGHVLSDGERELHIHPGGIWFRRPPEERPTVGDWVLVDAARSRIDRCLTRATVLRRRAAGSRAEVQLIGANVDALFVVTSCNAEFSAARLQRYLAVAADAGIPPLVVLTKADLAAHPQRYRKEARRVAPGTPVEVVDARDAATLAGIRATLRPAHTYALVGSSGVGKSTLVNTLAGRELQITRPIREQDAKGRHTTTSRSLCRLPNGALVLDGPGVRELAVAIATDDVEALFDDIEALAARCRFADCRHDAEPGCAVLEAIAAGRLHRQRLRAYRSLVAAQQSRAKTAANRHPRPTRRRRGANTDDYD